MNYMFYGATTFNQNIGGWGTLLVKDMSRMFKGAAAFNQNINGWRLDSVKNMAEMFCGAAAFDQDLSRWIVHKGSLMESSCYSVTSVAMRAATHLALGLIIGTTLTLGTFDA